MSSSSSESLTQEDQQQSVGLLGYVIIFLVNYFKLYCNTGTIKILFFCTVIWKLELNIKKLNIIKHSIRLLRQLALG